MMKKNKNINHIMRLILLEISKDQDTACSIYNNARYQGYCDAIRDLKIIIKQLTGYEGG